MRGRGVTEKDKGSPIGCLMLGVFHSGPREIKGQRPETGNKLPHCPIPFVGRSVTFCASAGLQHWSKENLARSEKDIASFLPDGMNPAAISPAERRPTSFATPLCSARPIGPPSRPTSPHCRRRGDLTSAEK